MYEERELATSAVPLRTEPDDIILGEHGLVRCTILNDRIHALVVDTSGEVAVWDIVRGVCLGKFLRDDVATASTAGSVAGGSNGDRERSPREALETVRERIEGEAVVSSWSNADTKAGVLMIHLNERCFDAEIYADEVGFAEDRRFHDESKSELIFSLVKSL
jgi:WD repeat-containing protein 48